MAIRHARHEIATGRHQEGLAQLNGLAATSSDPLSAGKILHAIADSQFTLRRLDEARDAYQAASIKLREAGSSAWFGAVLGGARCALEALRIEDGIAIVAQGLEALRADVARWSAMEKLSPLELRRMGVLTLPPRPVRPQVALTKAGQLFLNMGYMDNAEEYFKQAILLSPNGASRAKQAMARICMASHQYEEAAHFAKDSLTCGRFQAKTLPAWELFFAARVGRGLPPFDRDLHAQLLHHALPTVKSRALLLILRTLRKHTDDSWKLIAKDYLSLPREKQDAAILFEIRKIQLADAQLNPSAWDLDIREYSHSMLRSPILSPLEAIALSKVFTKHSCETNPDFTFQDCHSELQRLRARFDEETFGRAIHAAALGAMLARRHDLARRLLKSQIDSLPVESIQRRKDSWALARMEALHGERNRAARIFLEMAAEPTTPPRFRIMAFSQGLRQLRESDGPIDLVRIERSLREIIAPMDDYSTLLDAARQLYLHGDLLKPLAREVAAKAMKLALATAAITKDPSEVVRILNHLARRQYFEFAQGHEIHRHWESMTDAERERLWSTSTMYWEYITLVVKSYLNADKAGKAKSLADSLLAEPNTPPAGYAMIACTIGEHLLFNDKQGKAADYFARATRAAPATRNAVIAHYWQAVALAAFGHPAEAAQAAQQVRKAIGGKPALGEEWAIDAKSHLLLKRILPGQAGDAAYYRAEFLSNMDAALNEDLTRFQQ